MAQNKQYGKVCKWDDNKNNGKIDMNGGYRSRKVDVYAIDLMYNDVRVGDYVSFVVISNKATDVRKVLQKKAVKAGILYYQKGFYTQSQMKEIESIFKTRLHEAPRVLFVDNYVDRFRADYEVRHVYKGQSKVMGGYDREFGFGIPTSFVNSYKAGRYVDNVANFKKLMDKLFVELKTYLQKGCDIIVPAPLDSELQHYNYNSKYYWNNKQVVFHNLGTGNNLIAAQLKYVQHHLDKLAKLASAKKIVRGTVSYNNYKAQKPDQNIFQPQGQHPEHRAGNLIFQTSWFDAKQMELIDAQYKYSCDYSTAPKFLFGDNSKDHCRARYSKREMFGGQASVMGHYDRTLGYGIVTTFFGQPTPNVHSYKKMMDGQFTSLQKHLLNGYDVVVPYPTAVDINARRHRYYKYGKQRIFHNLGTGIAMLSFDHIQYIQHKIDELKKVAYRYDHASFYNYDSKIKQLMKTVIKPNFKSKIVPKSAPKSVMISAAHQKLIDSREWQCNSCSVINQGFANKCNQCHNSRYQQQHIHIQEMKRNDVLPAVNDNETQKLRKKVSELEKELQKQNDGHQKLVTLQQGNLIIMLRAQLKSLQQQSDRRQQTIDKLHQDNESIVTQATVDKSILEALQADNEKLSMEKIKLTQQMNDFMKNDKILQQKDDEIFELKMDLNQISETKEKEIVALKESLRLQQNEVEGISVKLATKNGDEKESNSGDGDWGYDKFIVLDSKICKLIDKMELNQRTKFNQFIIMKTEKNKAVKFIDDQIISLYKKPEDNSPDGYVFDI